MKEEIILSNDAFFLLSEGQEPLDDLAYPEAEKIASRFPNGFTASFIRYLDNGLLVALFEEKEPEREDSPGGPCLYFESTLYDRLQAWITEDRKVKYRWTRRGVPGPMATVDLLEGPYGPYFVTEKGSTIPIKSLSSE